MLEQLLEIVVTKTEKQTAQSAMGADTPGDLMERLAQLEEESTRMQTTLRMKERFLAKHELRLLGKSKVVTRENEGERSRLSEAVHRRSAQCSRHDRTCTRLEKKDGGAAPVSCTDERERLNVHSESFLDAAHVDKWKASALVHVGEPGNGLAAGRILA